MLSVSAVGLSVDSIEAVANMLLLLSPMDNLLKGLEEDVSTLGPSIMIAPICDGAGAARNLARYAKQKLCL